MPRFPFPNAVAITKVTAGDPVGTEGMIYVNTADNTVKIYLEGAWRTLASW